MKFKEALSFFSRLPSSDMALPKDCKCIFLWFPFVGLVIGTIVAFCMGIADFFLPSFFVGIIGCIVWLVLTGGANLTGVAYCGDMLFTPASEKLLKHIEAHKGTKSCATGVAQNDVEQPIASEQKTSCCKGKKGQGHFARIGVYGFAILFFVLITKTLALTLLATHYDIAYNYNGFIHLVFVCIGAAMFARCVAFFATLMPTAKQEGFAYELAKPLFDFHYAVVGVLAFIICYFSGISAFFMLIVSALFTLYLLFTAKKRLGGLTENVLACITEVSECITLLAFCLCF